MSEWWQDFFLSGEYRQLEEIPPERTEEQVEFVRATLSLEPGSSLLDVACGIGRHSLPLAARGIHVTGLDYTPAYLARARAGADGVEARFARGDMRRIPFGAGAFDAAINLFTSFGYFDAEADNLVALREIARVLRPGGRFLIDTINRDGLVLRWRDRQWEEVTGGLLLQDSLWDARLGRAHSRWTYVRNGQQPRSFLCSNRVYTMTEMEALLNAAGFEVIGAWGGWDGSPLGLDSRRLIVLADKAD